MSDSGRGKGRLVADRRYPNGGAKGSRKPTGSKPTGNGQGKGRPASGGGASGGGNGGRRTAPRKPARRTAKKRNFLVAFVFGIVSFVLSLIWRITWRVTAVVALLLALGVGYFYTKLPPVTELLDGRARGSVTLIDRNGAIFAWRGDQFGGAVTATSVSKHLRNAVIATEDKRFYKHFGVSPRGVASAIRINLAEGRGPLSGHGGSTITQQTAKLLCIGVEYDASVWDSEADYVADCRESSLARKGKEALYAMAM